MKSQNKRVGGGRAPSLKLKTGRWEDESENDGEEESVLPPQKKSRIQK